MNTNIMPIDNPEYINCVGVDGKLHLCKVDAKTCYCHVGVVRKKLLRDDFKKDSCYECTY